MSQSKSQHKNNHLLWVDVMKGIGILTVVAGHVYLGDITRIIFLFHMPLFFFLSGYLLKPTKNYKSYFLKKVNHLIVPYIFFLIIIYVLSYGLPDLNLKSILKYFYSAIIGGRKLGDALGVFWFITCLFLTQQLVNFLITKFTRKTVVYILLVFLILSYINSLLLPKFWLPLNANVVLAAAPIFYIGFCFKQSNFSLNNVVLLLVGIAIIVASIFIDLNYYEMKNAVYGIPIITLVSSLIIILNIKYISELLSKISILNKPLIELGKASMVIMYLHQGIQIIVFSNISQNGHLRFVLATLVSYLFYLLFKQSKYTRALCLGDTNAFSVFKV